MGQRKQDYGIYGQVGQIELQIPLYRNQTLIEPCVHYKIMKFREKNIYSHLLL